MIAPTGPPGTATRRPSSRWSIAVVVRATAPPAENVSTSAPTSSAIKAYRTGEGWFTALRLPYRPPDYKSPIAHGAAANILDSIGQRTTRHVAVSKSVAAGEHLFVNTYLVGVTACAAAGRSTLARYAAELPAVESEHRVLGQFLAGASPPNDLGFAVFEFDRVSQIKSALTSAGFGFAKHGTSPGRFYGCPSRRRPRLSRSARTSRDRSLPRHAANQASAR